MVCLSETERNLLLIIDLSSELDWSQRTIQWPARFPDLSPLDLFCGVMKNLAYKNRPQNILWFLQNGKSYES